MRHFACFLVLFTCIPLGAGAQSAKSIDRATELASRLNVESEIDAIEDTHASLARKRIDVVVSEFKKAGLSPEAQAELEKLASSVEQRIALSWSKAEAKSRFVGVLASRLPFSELENAITLYSEPRNAQAVTAICKAGDVMRVYVETSNDAASRTALPEFLQAARKLR